MLYEVITLQGGIAVAFLADVPADTFGIPVLNGGEDPHPAFVQGEDPGAVRAPHEVGGQSDDFSVMLFGGLGPAPVWREQMVLAHQA